MAHRTALDFSLDIPGFIKNTEGDIHERLFC